MTSGEHLWMGKPISTLSREELIEVVNFLGNDYQKLRDELFSIRKAVDWKKYLTLEAK